ncbi:MAG: hypothetical protein AAGE59_03870 [Cyanobacteria bacterium P01_F01_bin.86]
MDQRKAWGDTYCVSHQSFCPDASPVHIGEVEAEGWIGAVGAGFKPAGLG